MITAQSRCYKPFRYPWAIELTRLHEDAHWTEDEAKVGDDIDCWNNVLSDEERSLVLNSLLLFTESDNVVGDNYATQLIPSVGAHEVRTMLLSFAAREGTHKRAYALCNETLGLKDDFYSEFMRYREMSAKVEFMKASDISTLRGRAMGFARSCISEGVFLFGLFTVLMNMQRQGKMIGFGSINDWSIRDESLHVEGNSTIFRNFLQEFPFLNCKSVHEEVYSLFNEAVALEDVFIDFLFESTLRKAVTGLSADELRSMIRALADRRLMQLGLRPLYNVKNPIEWASLVFSGASVSNFFERRQTDYSVKPRDGNISYSPIDLSHLLE